MSAYYSFSKRKVQKLLKSHNEEARTIVSQMKINPHTGVGSVFTSSEDLINLMDKLIRM